MKSSLYTFVLLIFCIVVSCSESEYTKLVKSQMSTGIVHDSLIFGMRFGQTKQLFFDQCWKLNNKKIVTHGSSNQFVQYKLPMKAADSSKSKITLNFYGIFNNEKIMTGMDMKFHYDGWSLWNKSLQADKLVPVVKDTLQAWFPGNDFISVKLKKGEKNVWVKIDGNRRILIEPLADSREVDARIDDLRYIIK